MFSSDISGSEVESNSNGKNETGPEIGDNAEEGAASCPVLEIKNVCSNFNLRCKLDLFDIAEKCISIEYNEGPVRKNFG